MTLPAGTGFQAQFSLPHLARWEAEVSDGPLVVEARQVAATGTWLVLCSREQTDSGTRQLRNLFGFCNDTALADQLLGEGFRVLDARIERDLAAQRLTVLLDGDPVLALLGLAGVVVQSGHGVEQAQVYRQRLLTPDFGRPDAELETRELTQTQPALRSPVNGVQLELAGLPRTPANWCWQVTWPAAAEAGTPGPIERRPRAHVWSLPPAYRFGGVEAIGLRLDLAEYGVTGADLQQLLEELARPLNFHRGQQQARWPVVDFEFRAASATLVIELLRYERMATEPDDGAPPQSQHELLVRVLVGRVDDASGQARDPAFHVPAIFVDNAWSRLIGRELQGFDKRLAAFCTAEGRPLRPDGCLQPGDAPRPLDEVAQVCLLSRLGDQPGAPIFELWNVPPVSDGDYIEVDEAVVLAGFDVSTLGWRQPDFKDAEFRRAFARQAIGSRLSGFRSIQVSPIDRRPMRRSWIGGSFGFSGLGVALPAAQPRLRLSRDDRASEAWNRLADLAGGQTLALPAGDWYRLRFDMTLTVDDGLAW